MRNYCTKEINNKYHNLLQHGIIPEEFVFQEILGERIKDDDKTIEFLVRWKDFHSKHSTWEPERKNDKKFDELINEFRRKRVK